MAWHVFTERTEAGTYASYDRPPLARTPPARDAEFSSDGCWAEEHDQHGLRVVYMWMDGELAKPKHVDAQKARKGLKA